jgi:hypothetical protein
MKASAEVIEQIKGKAVEIFNQGPSRLEEKHGYTKHGHGRHYIQLSGNLNCQQWLDVAFDRRCDASRFARKHGATSIKHWWSF